MLIILFGSGSSIIHKYNACVVSLTKIPATAIEASNIDDFKKRIVDYFCIIPAID